MKLVSLVEAASLVRSGDTLALGGMTLYRRPVGFVRQLIRVGLHDLTLLSLTAGYESDLLVGAGCANRVRTCYFGLEIFGLAPMFTALAPQLEIVEETESSIAFGLRAAMSGLSFMPARAWIHTDLLKVRPDVRTLVSPYSDETYVAFPALVPDVAVIHVAWADPEGNAILGGNWALDRELAVVAERVILTAEEVRESLEGEIDIFSLSVDAVVHLPGGAVPTSCYPHYR
ncbi:MAG: CoA transferase subunit A, partial [Chloroflexi bacterium]|nr:CoA transferase subunit A [Chloroflexota bacterium]